LASCRQPEGESPQLFWLFFSEVFLHQFYTDMMFCTKQCLEVKSLEELFTAETIKCLSLERKFIMESANTQIRRLADQLVCSFGSREG
jgi:hypothetical protein